jgi:hypothetical protein
MAPRLRYRPVLASLRASFIGRRLLGEHSGRSVMNTSTRTLLSLALVLSSAVRRESDLGAAPITWIGGNTTWSDNVGASNFTPADEPDSDDEAIFNTPNNVTLGSNNSIAALTMSAGIGLTTDGFDLDVNGLVQVVDSSTDLIISGAGSVVQADSVTINNLGEVRLSGGSLNVIEETANGVLDVNAGGSLTGQGTVNLQDLVPGITALIINDGTISASVPSVIIGGVPPAGTLSINLSDTTDGRIDLDGTSGNGVVSVFRNQTLDLNGTLSDAMSGDINLSHNSTLDISTDWTLDTGTIDVNNGFVAGTPPLIPDTPADVAFISGGAFTQTGGTITIEDTDGTLQFNALFTQTGGTVTNNGLVVFNANATIGAGAAFNMPTANSSITVNSGVTVNVDQANFNPDGAAGFSNVITVNSGGVLDFDLGAGADEGFGGRIILNGGELDVTTLSDAWSIDRSVDVGASTGTSTINGEEVTIASATITVGANSTLDFNAPKVWGATGNLVTNAGAVTRLDGTTSFSGDGTFTGAGSLLIGGAATFAAVTTINMPAGTVDLDGADLFGNTVTVNSNTTINVGTMNSFGANTFAGTDTLVLNTFASLTVNLTDPNAEWTLTSNGLLDINAIGGMLGGSGIQGSDFNMAGTATISGNSIWTARTDISGTATVAAAGSLNLRGGDLSDANVNRLVGGTINGAGALRALSNEGLFGFGTIDAAVEFQNNTELRADDGILTVNGSLTDVGALGTADVDGILNIPAAWNSGGTIDGVDMRGGEIRGGTITNDNIGGINGFGLVSSRVINNTRIDGEGGGTLIVETAANNNDWDGAANTGLLIANTGNLEIRDNASFLFNGTVSARPGRTVLASGFELEFDPASTLNLLSGTYRSTVGTDFGGDVNVSAGADSTLANDVSQTLENGSVTTLNGSLQLDSPLTVVQVGADIAGAGSLINRPGRILRLLNGVTSADLTSLVENQGTLQLGGAAAAGQVQAVDYQQEPTGLLDIDLGGTGLNDFDRMNLTGAASLAGTLDIDLFGGYVPAIGNTLNILSATGGVVGAFTAVSQPAGMPAGLLFDVVYSPTLVQLMVVNAPIYSADFDLDGDVDGDDLTQWEGDFGVNDLSDADNDGDSDGADFLAWQQQLGSVPAVPAGAAVPEPAASTLVAIGILGGVLGRRRLSSRFALGG